jgi:diguanylate cyclase (GGDEF)-like protein
MIDKSLQEEDRKFQKEARRIQRFAQRSQIRLYFVLAAVTLSPLLSFFLYFNSARTALDGRLSELTTVLVKAAASQIDADAHALIVAGSDADLVQLSNSLNALQVNIPKIERITTLSLIDGQIFTILDTAQNDSIQNDGQGPNGLANKNPYTEQNTSALKSYMEMADNAGIDPDSPFINESTDYIENCVSLPLVSNAYPTLVCVEVMASEYFVERNQLRNNFLLASLLMLVITVFIVYSVVQHQRQVQLSMSLLRKQRDYFLKSSRTDALTGVMNRRAFQRSYALAEAQLNRNNIGFAVIAIDIDHFKPINDKYGHDAGDQALVALVNELSRVLRKNDFLARMGGEEFCVLCTLHEASQAVFVAEKLRKAIEALKVPLKDDNFIQLTISLGVHKVGPDETMEDVLKAADVALYVAKSRGRNRSVFYTKGMETEVTEQLSKAYSSEESNALY